MASNEFSGGAEHAEIRALQERVRQLELDVAALRSQVAHPAAAAQINRPAAQEAVTPPPPPLPLEPAAADLPRHTRLVSARWTEKAHAQPEAGHPRESLESRLGSQYFNRIAILLLLIGTAYGMKLAVDRGILGPPARIILGLLAGAALVLWSERFRKRGFAAFSYSLKALGSGVLYLALWAAFRLYHLLPAPAALLLMILVTAWNAYMAWAQNAELLAGYALAGGFATPFLLSTGGDHEIFLFTYLLAIDVATTLLVRLRRWPRLLLAAFPLTVGYFCGWFAVYFVSTEFAVTSLFIALFAGVFAAVPLAPAPATPHEATSSNEPPLPRRIGTLENILLPLANAAFAALAFYAVLQHSGRHSWLPWLMLLLAAVYLVLMRLPQSRVASAIHLSLAVVFLTIAIPLKASGHWITVSWLVEGVALTWVATRLFVSDDESAYASGTLRWLAMAALLLGFAGVCVHVLDTIGSSNLPLFNRGLGTAVTGLLAFALAAWLATRAASQNRGPAAASWTNAAALAVVLVPVTAVLLSLSELVSWTSTIHPPFQTTEFLTALLALAVFAAVIAIAFRQHTRDAVDPFWTNLSAFATIAFNLLAVLTGVREVSALFSPAPNALTADAALQQSLAISGFLMLYGALLLAVGFWKRSGFLRWQALALLLFTILKAFLYDMRNLSQGYRVISLMALGALLLAVSFAYQKDWLNLKAARPVSSEQDAP